MNPAAVFSLLLILLLMVLYGRACYKLAMERKRRNALERELLETQQRLGYLDDLAKLKQYWLLLATHGPLTTAERAVLKRCLEDLDEYTIHGIHWLLIRRATNAPIESAPE